MQLNYYLLRTQFNIISNLNNNNKKVLYILHHLVQNTNVGDTTPTKSHNIHTHM